VKESGYPTYEAPLNFDYSLAGTCRVLPCCAEVGKALALADVKALRGQGFVVAPSRRAGRDRSKPTHPMGEGRQGGGYTRQLTSRKGAGYQRTIAVYRLPVGAMRRVCCGDCEWGGEGDGESKAERARNLAALVG
jgi:hypothetical protein